MKKESFEINFDGAVLAGDTVHTGASPQWLFLHGAGTGDRKRFARLRTLLADKGIASSSFDFIGHGETGGDLLGSSLESRVAQASAVIDSRAILQPLSIVASSMGGYIAIKLVELYEIRNLVLIAPAVYATRAYSAPFGLAFTEAIRSPSSWQETDAWRILEKYKGNLSIYEAEKDQVIPRAVISGVYNSAQNAKSKERFIIKNATHSFAKWLDERPNSLRVIADKIRALSRTDY